MSEYILFKFRSINKYLIDSLVNSTLYFAHPNKLNDPFDCQVDIQKAAENAVLNLRDTKQSELLTRLRQKGFYEHVQKDTGNVGICSFSMSLKNPLLWSHYADIHRGISLMFEFPVPFLEDPQNKILGISKIDYNNNPLTSWFIESVSENITVNFEDFTVELLKKVLTIKSKPWDYEEEVRIIKENEGPLAIPKHFLKQVCFGLRASEQDISLIRKILDNAGYSVVYCQIIRSGEDFGLDTKEI